MPVAMAGLACGDDPGLYWVRSVSGHLLPGSGGGEGSGYGCGVCRTSLGRDILDIPLGFGGPVVHTAQADQGHYRGGEPS